MTYAGVAIWELRQETKDLVPSERVEEELKRILRGVNGAFVLVFCIMGIAKFHAESTDRKRDFSVVVTFYFVYQTVAIQFDTHLLFA